MRFRFERLAIPEVILVTPEVAEDARGFFMESYKRSAFAAGGIEDSFVQDNHSSSAAGVLRGLHYQVPPAAHAKLVRCVRGEILDVAVDIRRGSPTFGHWVSARLSAESRQQLYVPVGFAHGFLVLSARAEVLYKISHEYAPDLERGVAWDDPAIGVAWGVSEPRLSQRDREQPPLAAAELPFVYNGS